MGCPLQALPDSQVGGRGKEFSWGCARGLSAAFGEAGTCSRNFACFSLESGGRAGSPAPFSCVASFENPALAVYLCCLCGDLALVTALDDFLLSLEKLAQAPQES